ncbi:MAG: non-ribosomal peptide synthetase [Pirellulales bacterium]
MSRVRPWITHPISRGEVANTYGPTECTDICGYYRLTQDNLDKYSFVPLGRPVDNVQMVIVNPDMTLCPIGQAGELCVGGAGVGAGYINDSELTKLKFVPNTISGITSSLIYKTGDQARWHQDGVVEFLGRLDHQVKIRGFRIELPEIERAAETHAAVNEAIVVVKSDSTSADAQLVCCYTIRPESCFADVDLRTHLSSILPAHMIPSLFEPHNAFPLSPNGKVDRKALTKLVQERPQLTSVSASDSDGLEKQIHSAWCQLLSVDRVGIDDNFFDAGGDSLKLARLHQHLEALLERRFPITDLFANPTVRGMSKHLGNPKAGEERLQQLKQRAQMQRQAMSAKRRPN